MYKKLYQLRVYSSMSFRRCVYQGTFPSSPKVSFCETSFFLPASGSQRSALCHHGLDLPYLELHINGITVIPWYSSASELIKLCTRPILRRKKNVSALGTFLGLVPLARTCMRHNATQQEKMPHRSVLVGFGTRHKTQNELTTSARVPLYTVSSFCVWYHSRNLMILRFINIVAHIRSSFQ